MHRDQGLAGVKLAQDEKDLAARMQEVLAECLGRQQVSRMVRVPVRLRARIGHDADFLER
jgi:hypothetical protein